MRYSLTFDDGPGPSTRALMAVLEHHETKATFFVLGRNLLRPRWASPQEVTKLLVAMVRSGHQLGNHTMTHQASPRNAHLFLDEVFECDALIREVYARAKIPPPRTVPFRLPYGVIAYTDKIDLRLDWLTSIGRVHTHWTKIICDWVRPTVDQSEAFFKTMKSHALMQERRNVAAVFCMHDAASSTRMNASRDNTVRAVDKFLRYATAQDWQSFLMEEVYARGKR